MKNRLFFVALLVFQTIFGGLVAKDFFNKQERMQITNDIISDLGSEDIEQVDSKILVNAQLSQAFEKIKDKLSGFKESLLTMHKQNKTIKQLFDKMADFLIVAPKDSEGNDSDEQQLFMAFVIKRVFVIFASKLYKDVLGTESFSKDSDIKIILNTLNITVFPHDEFNKKYNKNDLILSFLNETIKIVQECLKKVAPKRERRKSSGVRAGFDESGRPYHFPPI